jgi:hypothetical protein
MVKARRSVTQLIGQASFLSAIAIENLFYIANLVKQIYGERFKG